MIRGVLVTHGALGAEFKRTAESIVGPLDGLLALSNSDCSAESLERRVEEFLADGDGPVFLFVDLFGGSCSFACDAVRRRRPETYFVSGLNLPMLLDFVHNRDRLPAGELAPRLMQKGRDGIQAR
ncbi:MAG: hypothetical protein IT349_01105 [Candidatus Eisenbacteria bacterium]|nr:hypothetical protein [Candidatus Eisenbacteria bacterium]MCC7140675.1 hypothetical protein [Candidatus Eisenbacteria bacterium]